VTVVALVLQTIPIAFLTRRSWARRFAEAAKPRVSFSVVKR